MPEEGLCPTGKQPKSCDEAEGKLHDAIKREKRPKGGRSLGGTQGIGNRYMDALKYGANYTSAQWETHINEIKKSRKNIKTLIKYLEDRSKCGPPSEGLMNLIGQGREWIDTPLPENPFGPGTGSGPVLSVPWMDIAKVGLAAAAVAASAVASQADPMQLFEG